MYLLLVLAIDQLAKFTFGSKTFGPVSAQNLDKEESSSRSLVKHFVFILLDTLRTVFVSLQFLATHANICNALLNCAQLGTLQSMVCHT